MKNYLKNIKKKVNIYLNGFKLNNPSYKNYNKYSLNNLRISINMSKQPLKERQQQIKQKEYYYKYNATLIIAAF